MKRSNKDFAKRHPFKNRNLIKNPMYEGKLKAQERQRISNRKEISNKKQILIGFVIYILPFLLTLICILLIPILSGA